LANLKIRIKQINTIVGDLQGNTQMVLNALDQANSDQVDLLVLQELVTCGYPPADLLERNAFRERIYQSNEQIVSATSSGKAAILFGTVTSNPGFGRKMFNSALLASAGHLVSVTHKTLLPTYDIFDELRYFEPNTSFEVVSFKGLKLGITICEDIWNVDNEIVYHNYNVNPAAILKSKGAQILFNVSASPYTKQKAEVRLRMLRNHAIESQLPIVYVNQVGSNTEVIFDGDSMVMNPDGAIVADTHMFEDSQADVVWDASQNTFWGLQPNVGREQSIPARHFRALKLGIQDFFRKSGLSGKAIVGLSGGVDSALVAVLATEALGAQNVTAVTLPSMYSSDGSVHDSKELAANLGITLHQIPIESSYHSLMETLQPVFEGTPFGIAEENIQSRIRGTLLMAFSNKFGCMLLNTGNKSELAVGYCTLYGDMNGGLSVISDLYKTEVYELCEWLNSSMYGRQVIPETILTKEPSAELRPGQKDSDSLPDYAELDAILKMYIEEQLSADEIAERGFNEQTVTKVIRLTDGAEFKRRQSPPGLRLSAKAFGIGRRQPIVQRWTP
jgi:NAD+ synthase (glutamine-hydrolysing)